MIPEDRPVSPFHSDMDLADETGYIPDESITDELENQWAEMEAEEFPPETTGGPS